MTESDTVESVLEAVDEQRVLELEQGAVRIPSPSFEETEVAEYFAKYMEELGLDVELHQVTDPFGSEKSSHQPVGRLRGSGDGPSLMFNGHMDHNPVVGEWDRDPFSGDFEDGWVYGRGSQDDKGGIVAAISAVEALIEADVTPKGDIIICPVMGHKSGGIGTRDLIDRGIIPDYCINTENSANGIANVSVGVTRGWVHAYAKPTHFGSSKEVRDKFFNPHRQISEVIQAMGPNLTQVPQDGWLTYELHPEFEGFPQLTITDFDSDASDEGRASMEFQVRLVPSQSTETVKQDLEQLLADLADQYEHFDTEIEMPPESGKYAGWGDWPAFETSRDSDLVQAQERWHEEVTGSPPVVGLEPRRGAVGDGNLFAREGSETLLYGPGDISEYSQWPTPNEKIEFEALLNATKIFALTSIDILGTE